jgi:hypothetical protein
MKYPARVGFSTLKPLSFCRPPPENEEGHAFVNKTHIKTIAGRVPRHDVCLVVENVLSLVTVLAEAVSRGECTTGLTWDPREGSHRANSGQARGCPMRRPAYEPSPQVKPVVHSPFDIKLAWQWSLRGVKTIGVAFKFSRWDHCSTGNDTPEPSTFLKTLHKLLALNDRPAHPSWSTCSP